MQQLSKPKSILHHLYPGIVIALCFILLTPFLIKHHYPPQLGLLISIFIAAIPLLIGHLLFTKKNENKKSVWELNGYKNKLSTGKLILYVTGLVVFAFLIWGITQPLNKIITDKIFSWLPNWYTVQDFSGYNKQIIQLTLILNLVLNGFIAPFVEELYFRGYLLPRMGVWGKGAFVANAV